jgi:hypothetical protein
MTQFDDREQAFENKFGHDEELEFKIGCRMAHLFGLWAAQQLGLSGKDAEIYANKGIDIEITRSGRVRLLEQTEKDFSAKGISFSRHRLEQEIEACYGKARGELVAKEKSS